MNGDEVEIIKGSFQYVAPEVVRLPASKDEKVLYDPFAADMWSLGVTFYEALSNTLPFKPKDYTKNAYLECLRDPKVKIDYAMFT